MQTRQLLQQTQDMHAVSQTHAPVHEQVPTPLIKPTHPTALIQRATLDPRSLSRAEVRQLQRTIGNRAVGQLLGGGRKMPAVSTLRRHDDLERENTPGLPADLKAGIEILSGLALDEVHVHYNSPKPAALQALAYTQGTDIYVAPGQEQHLPHEAWHVVQQAQGRVQPTLQMKDGVHINDDTGLEHEAEVMGATALANATQLQGAPEEQELLQSKFAPLQSTGLGQGELQTRKSPSVPTRSAPANASDQPAAILTTAQGITTKSHLAPGQIHSFQQTIGDQAVQHLSHQRTQSQVVSIITSGQIQLIQRVKDFNSAGVPQGSGLTESAAGPYGKWHIHVIRDDEGLGLIARVFIRFEDREYNNQHLRFDQDGNLEATNLSRTGPRTLVQWGTEKVQDLLKRCTEVSGEEIEGRRQAKAEREKKDREAMAKLPPSKEPAKAVYSGKQSELFGSTATAVSEEAAINMMKKVGITTANRDFNMIKAKIKDGLPKDKWPSFIQQYYALIYPPIPQTMSDEQLDQLVSNAHALDDRARKFLIQILLKNPEAEVVPLPEDIFTLGENPELVKDMNGYDIFYDAQEDWD